MAEPQAELINDEVQAMMYTCEVIYRNGQTMCSSIGSSRRQAERNAAVVGLIYLDNHKDELAVVSTKKGLGQPSGQRTADAPQLAAPVQNGEETELLNELRKI